MDRTERVATLVAELSAVLSAGVAQLARFVGSGILLPD
jgi:hypothetical protein